MNAESIIKSRLAESVVEMLLEESGYKIVRVAQEGLLNGFSRDDSKKFNQSDSAGKITTAPSFAVLKDRKVTLVKVKFRGAKRSGRNVSHGIQQVLKYWPEAELVVVTDEEPYFSYIKNANGEALPLEALFPQIKKATRVAYVRTVQKFLPKG